MMAVRADRVEGRKRVNAALGCLVAEADKHGVGDSSKKAAVGFCFGGGNVLELARTGAEIQAAVCLHGDLTTGDPAIKEGQIRSALLVVHGSADPVANKSQRDAFEAEMDGVKAKWQMLTFGGLVHSFCESDAHVPGIAEHNEAAARQSYRLLDRFITDAFEGLL